MSPKQLPTGPHAVTGEMLRRDMARHTEVASAMSEAENVEPPSVEQAELPEELDQFFSGSSAVSPSTADQPDQWPFAMPIERLKREVVR